MHAIAWGWCSSWSQNPAKVTCYFRLQTSSGAESKCSWKLWLVPPGALAWPLNWLSKLCTVGSKPVPQGESEVRVCGVEHLPGFVAPPLVARSFFPFSHMMPNTREPAVPHHFLAGACCYRLLGTSSVGKAHLAWGWSRKAAPMLTWRAPGFRAVELQNVHVCPHQWFRGHDISLEEPNIQNRDYLEHRWVQFRQLETWTLE